MHRGTLSRWWLLAALALPSSARAQEDTTRARPLSITISGGVSLGAYEAGLLYYVVETARLNPGALDPRVFTGASAGSINALTAALESCRPPEPRPSRSLFWRTWMPVGLGRLYQPDQVHATAVFTREAFAPAVAALDEAWRGGLRPGCDVLVGMTATRVRALNVPVQGQALRLPRSTERFLLRIRSSDAGAVVLTNHAGVPGALLQPLLPLDGPDADPFGSVTALLSASSAFPIAFAPVAVAHCLAPGGANGRRTCMKRDARSDQFVDGGFLDNQPVGLAATALRAGVYRDAAGVLRIRDQALDQVPPIPADALLLHVSPDVRTHPSPPMVAPESKPGDRVVAMAAALGGELIDGARNQALETVLGQDVEVRERLVLARGHLPKAGEPLFGFMGFMEEEFRRFDFMVGMYDAHRVLQDAIIPRGNGTALLLPEVNARHLDGARAEWAPYRCLHAVLDAPTRANDACRGADLKDFRILLRVSLERLYDGCVRARQQGTSPDEVDDPRCRAAMEGARPPRVPYVEERTGWAAQAGESDLRHVTRRLGGYGFLYRDLGLPRASSGLGQARIRSVLSQVAASLAIQQGRDALPAHVALEAGLNTLAYRPPRHLVHALMGPQPELGWSTTGPDTWMSWLRLSTALGFDGIDTLLSSRATYVGLTPLLGVEAEPLFFSGSWLQPRLGARAGMLFSSADLAGFGSCHVGAQRQAPCSRLVFQGMASLSVLHLLRLQLSAHWWPAIRHREPHLWSVAPSVGLQLPFAW
ncbi:MAG: patatin-like phospholipase family protein [Deltaproteobacteria bacterium]|nr:patatin-like phospholipase family protein [Deltaproteobacteria bacterium]